MAPLLPRCLDSLVNQTLREIEIICVDDGSTDNSAAVVQEYAERDTRVRLIRQPNMGRAAARDTGIQAATGEWLGFVDPDDYADTDMYEKMHRRAVETGADMVQCFHKVHTLIDTPALQEMAALRTAQGAIWARDAVFTGNGLIYKLRLEGTVTFFIWDKLIRRIPAGQNTPVLCDPGFHIVCGEDGLYLHKTLKYCHKIALLGEQLYNYAFGGPHSCFTTARKYTSHPVGLEQAHEYMLHDLMQHPEWHTMRVDYMLHVAPTVFWGARLPLNRLEHWVALWRKAGITPEHFAAMPAKQRYYLQAAFQGRRHYIRLFNIIKLLNRNLYRWRMKLLGK